MNSSLFTVLLNNLLHVNVMILGETGEGAEAFEQKYCYNPVLQTVYTAQLLHTLFASMQDQVIYGINDDLGLCIQFFRFEGCLFLVGPYAKTEFDPVRTQRTLMKAGMSASFLSSVRLYYSAFPILSDLQVRNTVSACIRSFDPEAKEYAFCRLHDVTRQAEPLQDIFSAALDYSSLYQRYDLENRFLQMIERGDTENVLAAYRDMASDDHDRSRYVNAVYTEPFVGLSMVRSLARKAAERGGASVVEVDEITQRCVQRILSSRSLSEQIRHSQTMIYELTDAVRRHRYQDRGYSSPVQKAVEYLSLNYTQKIRLSQLAKRVGLSEAYLSRTFKNEVGMTVSRYTARLRCQTAAQMLKKDDTPIQEISSFVGYPDNNYFVKVFRAQYGMTPSEYRAARE